MPEDKKSWSDEVAEEVEGMPPEVFSDFVTRLKKGPPAPTVQSKLADLGREADKLLKLKLRQAKNVEESNAQIAATKRLAEIVKEQQQLEASL